MIEDPNGLTIKPISMKLTYYRKYRPRIFEEIEGQEHIVKTLQGALLSGRIAHAYLFTGPKGTGKTTLARLFAKALNCEKLKIGQIEPCNKCDSCVAINNGSSLDLIEIDAASNRGIDEIRNIKDSALVAATSSNYKIFVIDEVHMLTPPAFNALLKTLEEPPSHVIFVLATTEPHKILATILSRVQRFDFKKITNEQIARKLKKIAKQEKLEIDEEVFATLADFAGGSLRDAESALSKLVAFAGEKISIADASEILGVVSHKVHQALLAAVQNGNSKEAIDIIANLYESGADLENFAKQFVNFLRARLISAVGSGVLISSGDDSPAKLIEILNVFLKARYEIKSSPIPQLPLELAVFELTSNGGK